MRNRRDDTAVRPRALRKFGILLALALTAAFAFTSPATAAYQIFFEGTLSSGDFSHERGSSSQKITEVSARKLSGSSSSAACVAARTENGTLVGSWSCVYQNDNVTHHPYCGCLYREGRARVEGPNLVNFRARQDW